MGPSYRYPLFLCLVLCGGTELCSALPLWLLPGVTANPVTPTSSVEVECLEAELVVTVNRDLFGTGKLVEPEHLTLGSESCQPLVSVDTDVVRFKAQLHECCSRVQVRLGVPRSVRGMDAGRWSGDVASEGWRGVLTLNREWSLWRMGEGRWGAAGSWRMGRRGKSKQLCSQDQPTYWPLGSSDL